MGKNKILVDSDALIALFKIDDSNHEKALKISAEIKTIPLYVSLFTIPESVTMLSYRVSHNKAKEFLRFVRKTGFVEFPMEEATKKLADDIFLQESKKSTSWFDCFNAALFKTYQLDAIFSFDKFYKRIGLRTVEELFL